MLCPCYETVIFGGGNGILYTTEKAKKRLPYITVIQTTFDSGGSAGDLRGHLGLPWALGDLRRGIEGLAGNVRPEAIEALGIRFKEVGSYFDGHSLGNIMMAGFLQAADGDLIKALDKMCAWYDVKGKVLPVSLDDSELRAFYTDGSVDVMEHVIDTRDDRRIIKRVELTREAALYEESRVAISKSKLIVFAPGSWRTSIEPILLVKGVKEAITSSEALVVLVTNIMSKRNEQMYEAGDFVRSLNHHLRRKIDVVICNNGQIPPDIEKKYREEEDSSPVSIDRKKVYQHATDVIIGDFVEVNKKGHIHHSEELAIVLESILYNSSCLLRLKG